jgi:hypothetical protein
VDIVTLFRPTGEKELALIRASGWREFPLLLPEQPMFCPMIAIEPATRFAREWSLRESGSA